MKIKNNVKQNQERILHASISSTNKNTIALKHFFEFLRHSTNWKCNFPHDYN